MWSATSQSKRDQNETSLRRRMPGGVEITKKVKESESVIEIITSEGEQVTFNPEDNLQVISEKAKDD